MKMELQQAVYFPGDIEAATLGYASSTVQHGWVARRIITTPIKEPRAGHAREYTLGAVYELAILAGAVQYGLSLPLAKQAVEKRLLQEVMGRDGWGEGRDIPLTDLPEFADDSPNVPWLWRVVISPSWEDQESSNGTGNNLRVEGVLKVAADKKAMDLFPVEGMSPLVMILNITKIVRQVNDVLVKRLRERESK